MTSHRVHVGGRAYPALGAASGVPTLKLDHSVKAQRLLDKLGVPAAFARGETLVLVGPTYELVKDPGIHVRLAFLRDDEGRLCVGYASDDGGAWQPVESEPFSMRALGYYERRVKRIGDFVESAGAARSATLMRPVPSATKRPCL